MIEILKKELEDKIKRPVRTRGDCELISNAILETLNLDISYNTLRRLYGLAPYTKPNNKTLNTLAKFIGYKNYIHFSQTFQFKDKIDLSQITYKAVSDGNDDFIIDLVIKTRHSSENFISFITLLIRELLHIKNYTLLDSLFKIEELKYENYTYSEILDFGNSIGLLFRKKPEIDSALLKNKNFLRCVFLTFVDYSSLNGYYGDFAEKIKENDIDYEISLFSSALLEFKNFVNLNPVKDIKLNNQIKLNPILNSRLVALKLMSKSQSDVEHILDKYYAKIKNKTTLIDHSYELFISAIITKNVILMKYLIEKINFNYETEYYYQKHHLNCYYLMCIFYYRINGLSNLERNFFNLFDKNIVRYSYQDFINILYQVYLFDKSKTKKQKVMLKEKYSLISEKLGYTIFSDSFIESYFI